MHSFLDIGILGLIQGLTEFLPVSSSGHLIIARELLGITTPDALGVDAVLQLATALAALIYFRHDVLAALRNRKLFITLVVATVPAVVLGVFLESYLETTFRSASLVAYALLAGSAIMLLAEYLPKKMGETLSLESMSIWRGFAIGCFQVLALVPGMSRSAMTISGGLFAGLARVDAARFSFVLSLPILFGSGLKKLYDLQGEGVIAGFGPELLVGCFVAFLSGLTAIYLLMAFVKNNPLTVFVLYRILLAAVLLAAL